MKRYFKILTAICLTMFVGCKTGDELYISPNNPGSATLPTLLTAIEVNTFATTEGELARQSSIFVQHSVGLAGAQYEEVQNYFINEGDYANSWRTLYSGTMNNAKILIDQAGSENPYYAGMGKVITAISLAVATDLWGDVPYSEALKADEGITKPKLDTQEEIYVSIDNLLKDAIDDFQKSESDNVFLPASDDVIYEGDISKWIKASYTLRARYLNRVSNKANNDAKILDYLSKGITANADNMEALHSSSGGTQNQWGAFQNSRAGMIGASKLFVDRLSTKSDPRISYFLTKNTANIYVGGDLAQATISPDISATGTFFGIEKNYPLITFYEAKFIQAEVLARQSSLLAAGVLNDAITASVEYVTGGAGDASAVANYVVASKTDVMTEKWVAMYNQSFESYNDFRRTGIPALTPRPKAVGAVLDVIPKRLPFPKETTLYNPNAKLIALNVPVWWAN